MTGAGGVWKEDQHSGESVSSSRGRARTPFVTADVDLGPWLRKSQPSGPIISGSQENKILNTVWRLKSAQSIMKILTKPGNNRFSCDPHPHIRTWMGIP